MPFVFRDERTGIVFADMVISSKSDRPEEKESKTDQAAGEVSD